ncbi:MAG: hypothetical protein EOO88_30520 [Pedobacter sp.]|nr:MAG: hypothetical protein EOO88_30520 [Pedobacter sp.]
MITTIAHLVRDLQVEENKKLATFNIQHPGTIGKMYEGLTSALLDLAIPVGFDVQVVTGFSEDVKGNLSPQADVMVVYGEGKKIPYTDDLVWPIRQVIAVLEIKKTLYGRELVDGLEKMKKVYELDLEARRSACKVSSIDLSLAVQAFAILTGYYPKSDSEAQALPNEMGIVFDMFKEEQLGPVRVILGYDGYNSELGLRNGVMEKIKAVPDLIDWPVMIPSLIICQNYSIVKRNGQPYCSKLTPEGYWPLLASTSKNPMKILLEQVWTKLTTTFKSSINMDDTLEMEHLSPLLACKFPVIKFERVPMYEQVDSTDEQLKRNIISVWAPESININESTLINKACCGDIDVTDIELQNWATTNGLDLKKVCENLVAKRFLVWSSATTLRPINAEVITVITSEGTLHSAVNPDLFGLWLARRLGSDK